tara:strand:+ start:482 stop:760 length:279 start_codon:yes stop_codon:yes gene_type:complete
MKVFKMDKIEILEAEIKEKIIFIQKKIFKLRTTDNQMVENIPKYLNTISSLQKENAKLKDEREKVEQDHNEDLKMVENLVDELSKLVEGNHA